MKKLTIRQAALVYAKAWHRCKKLQHQYGLNIQNAARAKKYEKDYDKAENTLNEAQYALLHVARQLVK